MTPIERAARAIAQELVAQEPSHGGTYFVDADNPKAAVIDGTFNLDAIVRAVLTVLRESSEVMESAGMDEADKTSHGVVVGPIWQAMVDAAMEQG